MTFKYANLQEYGNDNFQGFKAWSLLSDAPVLFYDKTRDEYYVYWYGIFAPRRLALAIAGHQIANIHITKSMVDSLIEAELDHSTLSDYYQNLSGKVRQIKERKNITAADLMRWFDIRNAS